MGRLGGPVRGLSRKSSRTDMVSDADRDAERLIVDMIRRERPDDGVLGEEGADHEGRSGRSWVLDPLDGTTNFLYGFPAWAVSIAVSDEEGEFAAVVHDPWREETFRALRGGGAELNEQKVEVRECDDLSTALVATGFGYEASHRAAQAEVLQRVLPRVRDIRRAGAASLDLCWVACGRLDAYYERGLKPWDWDAGSLIVAEAGGALRRLDGDPPCLLAAASGELLDALAELVQ